MPLLEKCLGEARVELAKDLVREIYSLEQLATMRLPRGVLKDMLAKGLEPSTVRLQVGRSTIELRQHDTAHVSKIEFFIAGILIFEFASGSPSYQ